MIIIRTFILFLLLIITVLGSGGFWLYQHKLQAPLPLINDWHYTLRANTNLSQVAIDLMKAELLDYPSALTWVTLARIRQQAHKIKAGEYAVPTGTTPQEFLNILIRGKSIQYTLTIPEGWNFRQLIAAVNAHPRLEHTLKELDPKAVMEKLGLASQHPEGRFYPDTYFFPNRFSDVAFLQRAYRKMETELAKAWQKRQKALPLKNPEEALILASIIEKETGIAEERREIAGVFIRRLKKGMRLQTDPTVIYALGETFDGNIRKTDLSINSPYNTYLNKGLPPTPIALPGRKALEAAVNPAEGNSLFFVAKGDAGSGHYFSASLSEHECAVDKYQRKKSPSFHCRQFIKHASAKD